MLTEPRKRGRGAVTTRWQQVEALEVQGLTRQQIAERLGIDRHRVGDISARAETYRVRGQDMRTTRQRLAEAMAQVYPDRNRQNWILWQMGLAERE